MKAEPKFRIIEADASHRDFLAGFGRRSFIDAYRVTLSLRDLETYTVDAFSPSRILDELNDPAITYYVCADEELNPCGYAKLIRSSAPACVECDRSIELQRIYIDSAHHGQGGGSYLLDYLEKRAVEQGLECVWLRVWDGNEGAIRLYEHAGFSTIGEEPYQVGKDSRKVIVMRKVLAGGR